MRIGEITPPARLGKGTKSQFQGSPGRLARPDRHGHLRGSGLPVHQRCPGPAVVADLDGQTTVVTTHGRRLNVGVAFHNQLQNRLHAMQISLPHNQRAIGGDGLAQLGASLHGDMPVVRQYTDVHRNQDDAHDGARQSERDPCSGSKHEKPFRGSGLRQASWRAVNTGWVCMAGGHLRHIVVRCHEGPQSLLNNIDCSRRAHGRGSRATARSTRTTGNKSECASWRSRKRCTARRNCKG